jgi:hypothetical protein
MAELVCTCTPAEASPTCEIIAGPGIDVANNGGGSWTITAENALDWKTTWTPNITNLTPGNWISESEYLLVGKTLSLLMAVKFGSTTAFPNANPWRIDLPEASIPWFDDLLLTSGHIIGECSVFDASANQYWKGTAVLDRTDPTHPLTVRFGDDAGAANTPLSRTVPIPFDVNDELVIWVEKMEVM